MESVRECGLDNNKSDKNYRINQSECDHEPLTHVHYGKNEKPEKPITAFIELVNKVSPLPFAIVNAPPIIKNGTSSCLQPLV